MKKFALTTAALAAAVVTIIPSPALATSHETGDYYNCIPTTTKYAWVQVALKGHVSVSMENLAGDYAQKDYFYDPGPGDPPYWAPVFRANYRIAGTHIFEDAWTTGVNADVGGPLFMGCSTIP